MSEFRWTNARREMLRQLAREPGYYASYYEPLKALIAAGYAETEPKDGDRFRLTPKGWDANGKFVAEEVADA